MSSFLEAFEPLVCQFCGGLNAFLFKGAHVCGRASCLAKAVEHVPSKE